MNAAPPVTSRLVRCLQAQSSLLYITCFFLLTLSLLSTPTAIADNLPIKVVSIEPTPLELKVNRIGKVDFRHKANLSFKTAGYIQKLLVDVGQTMRSNATIATLEANDLVANQKSAQASYRKATQDLERARKLYRNRTVSKDFLEQAETAQIQAKAQLENTQYDINKSEIQAPFHAIVLDRLVQPGELVAAGSPVYLIASSNPDNLVVKLDLTQSEIELLKYSVNIQVTLPDNQKVSGEIASIAAITNPQTGLYEIEILLDIDKTNRPYAGQWLQTTLTTTNTEQLVYSIPLSALAGMKDENAIIWVSKKGKVAQKKVKVLRLDHNQFLITANHEPLNVVVHGWGKLGQDLPTDNK
ncbi:efflux RND transporter periplasmic adaptor subunit [Vibrio sp. Of7-15]|uniref:efflux RND transporter periplasmic adaptor subunit n=1 Tax=Vibrio sp. Of7-15 TaxID=2724879 RepID=UPI001EF2DF41|nr:efflux RND transporter periplasmic adaptor subunit [Vibrio sp. Of7-15]MCG7495508.1 efflux RND transporter periplasmic adaptor subunit [Vibrio sp. Of7-15]